jgi:hypothetical protein
MKKLIKQISILILSSIVIISCSQSIDMDKDKQDIKFSFITGILKRLL